MKMTPALCRLSPLRMPLYRAAYTQDTGNNLFVSGGFGLCEGTLIPYGELLVLTFGSITEKMTVGRM